MQEIRRISYFCTEMKHKNQHLKINSDLFSVQKSNAFLATIDF